MELLLHIAKDFGPNQVVASVHAANMDRPPHSPKPSLTVRCFGSQIVAFIEVPGARGAGAFGPAIVTRRSVPPTTTTNNQQPGFIVMRFSPQMGAVGPNVILPGVGVHACADTTQETANRRISLEWLPRLRKGA